VEQPLDHGGGAAVIKVERTIAAPDVLTKADGIGDRERRANAEFALNGNRPTGETAKHRGFTFRAYKERSVKQTLEQLFGGKCAYCELTYEGASPADVEHWRPKAAVLTGDNKRLPRGYYWLASEWTNLLPSCPRCNREEMHSIDGTMKKVGKANKFPLADEAGRATSPEMVAKEQPLLLDPCVDSPEEHLEFFETENEKGLLRAKSHSVRGQASIDIYGLNRPGLVQERREHLGYIKYVLDNLKKAVTQLNSGNKTEAEQAPWLEQLDNALLELRKLRMAKRKFCALARATIDPQLAALGIPLESPVMTVVTTPAAPAGDPPPPYRARKGLRRK
jgi:uncharacterized protein (TIGR02646 family)